MNVLIGLAAFGIGVAVLVESVEGLVKTLRAWAAAASVSGVFLAAIVLGFDLESTAAGVAATLDDLPGTALGTSIGAAIFLVTAGLGIAGLIAPFELRTPRPLLAAPALATATAIVLSADGELTQVDGGLLLASFAALVALMLQARWADGDPERPPGKTYAHPWRRVLLGLAGLLIGAELLVFGTGRIVEEIGVSETVFGMLVVAAAVSLEEVVLEALPAFRGFPELSVGNALGTLTFLLTGSLGVIVLVNPIEIPRQVVDYHLPALALTVLLAGAILARGRLRRGEGGVLVGAYAVYAAGALLV